MALMNRMFSSRGALALVGAFFILSPVMAQDGKALFAQRCQGCHTRVAGQAAGIGPNLAGVVGRKAATTNYDYSAALKASGLKWDKKTLDEFLAGPGALVPGTKMPVSVTDAEQRAAIVAFLQTLGSAK
jgi:cytochrome c